MARLKSLLMAGVFLGCLTSSAMADPGTLIVSSILGSAAAAGAIGTALAGVINIGLAFGLSLLAPKPEAPKPQDVQNVIRQSMPPRTRHYGLKQLGGSQLFIEARDGNVWQIVAFASQRFDSVVEWLVDNRHVELGTGGVVTTDPYYEQKVRITYRPGNALQTAYDALIEKFPTIWTEAHRANGIAHALLETRGVPDEKFSKIYPNRIAKLNGVFRTARVYDPRSAATAYSANLSLHLRDYLRHEDGLQIEPEYIDDADFIKAANDSDVLLPTKSGGTVRRYHGALSYSFEADPQSVLNRFLTATDGRLCLKSNGKIGFSVGVWVEPTVIITDDHIIDFSLSDGAGPLRESNEILVKYEEPLADFAASDAQPWRQDDEIAEYGEVRSKTIDAYEIQNHNHARRIAKIFAHRAAPRWQGKITTTLFGMQAWDQRWVRVQIPDLDTETDVFDETMEVLDISLDHESMVVTLQLASFGPDAYAFDPATEEGTAPALPDRLEEGSLPAIEMATAIGTQRQISGGVKVALIKASVAAPDDRDDLQLEVEYTLADDENWQGASVGKGAYAVDIVGLEDSALYDIRFRWRGGSGSVGPYALIENIPAVADPTPPGPASNFDALPGPTAGTVAVAWTNPNSENFKAARVYRNSTTSFATATDLEGPIYGSPGTGMVYEDTPPSAGTWYYWVLAENGSGKRSAAVGPASEVV